MSNIAPLIAADPNLSPAFRRLFANPRVDLLTVAADKAAPRRFSAEPITGFGGIGERGSERWREVRDQEGADHDREERHERIERGE